MGCNQIYFCVFNYEFHLTTGSLNFHSMTFLITTWVITKMSYTASFNLEDFQKLILKYFVHLALCKLKHINRKALKDPRKVKKGSKIFLLAQKKFDHGITLCSTVSHIFFLSQVIHTEPHSKK